MARLCRRLVQLPHARRVARQPALQVQSLLVHQHGQLVLAALRLRRDARLRAARIQGSGFRVYGSGIRAQG